MTTSTLIACALGLVCALRAPASANPHPLPFSYQYETLPEDKLEVEQYIDLVPLRVERMNDDGTLEKVWDVGSVMTTELELGITDRLEAGFYFQLRQDASGGEPSLRFEGVKQRLRYRFAEAGELPVDIGVYLEIAEFHDELELEQKLLLSRRFGDLVLVANLWVEQEWAFRDSELELIYNPTVGAAFEISPRFHVGLEYWVRGVVEEDEEAATPEPGEEGAHQYLGPTFLYQQGPLFWALGVYTRMDHLGERVALGDPYGRIWIRSIVGVEL